ncbi:MAG: hypothetical protein ACI82G_000710 [Bradymonadia bacterium]|jgi:hypothetical protein
MFGGAGCGSDDAIEEPDVVLLDSGEDAEDGGTDDATTDATDVGVRDVPEEPDIATGLLDSGSPCQSNLECLSGFCVPGAFGFVCSTPCTGDCPDIDGVAYSCEDVVNGAGDALRVCLPLVESVCAPCLDNANCSGGACVELSDGSVCGTDCERDDDCPSATACFTSAGAQVFDTPQCLPETLSCACTDENDGETRPCVRGDAAGSLNCTGVETCDARLGWVGCDAPLPEPEVCDGIDNDCNGIPDDGVTQGAECVNENEFGSCGGTEFCDPEVGVGCRAPTPAAELCDFVDNDCDGGVDEDFINELGFLLQDEHCGVCGNSCAARYPEGYVSSCQLVEDTPICVIDACPPGFAAAGPLACVPLDSALCASCDSNDDCNDDVGDACVSYGDASFCGRDCGVDSVFGEACPDGYSCGATGQCVRTEGSCGCEPGDSFLLPCQLRSPGGDVCFGRQACDDGTVGVCEPPEDTCNAVDDDCDGVVDGPFVDESGAYVSDEHCGRCFNDCALVYAGASNVLDATCGESGGEAVCTASCAAGFGDADGLTFNGCECERLSDTDLPDPLGIDANCDGIDGEVSASIFVARTGSDATGDGTRENPFESIRRGIEAGSDEQPNVLIGAGVYAESVSIRNGISVFGGYGVGFDNRDIAGNETAIIGPAPTAENRGALNAKDIDEATTVQGLTIIGYDRTEPGASSYAVWLRDVSSSFVLDTCRVRAGNGGDGVSGGSGGTGATAAPGAPTFSPPGDGRPAVDSGGLCPNPPTASLQGGGGAAFVCFVSDVTVPTSGGRGGLSDCPDPNTQNPPGEPGTAGAPAFVGGSGAPAGFGGGGGTHLQHWSSNNADPPVSNCNLCIVPAGATDTIEGQLGGNGARGEDGAAGGGCAGTLGTVVGGDWSPGVAASGGGIGGPGSGGGGGGAGGGVGFVDRICISNEVLGGSGGGGGAGGCGGLGGSSGGVGGGSFAVFVLYTSNAVSIPQLTDNMIERGIGGNGGSGGPGGIGGEGSPGAPGTGSALGCPGEGGSGGDGGPGGPGGGGGGGCAGIAAGVWVGGTLPPGASTEAWQTNNAFPATGSAGLPGDGGASAGSDGTSADSGLYEPVLPCADGGAPPCR